MPSAGGNGSLVLRTTRHCEVLESHSTVGASSLWENRVFRLSSPNIPDRKRGCPVETVSQPCMGLRHWNEMGKSQPRMGRKSLAQRFSAG